MENKEGKMNRKGLIAVLALAAAVIIAGGIYMMSRPAVSAGEKHIIVEVIGPEGASEEFTYDTDEEYLRGVLEPAGLISGDESEYGMYVKTVAGYTADEAGQEWWYITKGGEQLNTGVDTTPVTDGDHFEITLTVGW